MSNNDTSTPQNLAFNASIAIKQLNQARRDCCCEINGRVRKLTNVVDSLQSAHIAHRDELFDCATVLTPEIAALIAAPLSGL